jgi:hypothetical protein
VASLAARIDELSGLRSGDVEQVRRYATEFSERLAELTRLIERNELADAVPASESRHVNEREASDDEGFQAPRGAPRIVGGKDSEEEEEKNKKRKRKKTKKNRDA